MIKLKKIAGIAPLQMRRGEAGTPILRPWSSFVAGVCVAFPAPISGLGIEGFPRLTDVLNVGCAGLLVFALFRSAPLHRAIYGTLLVWAMTLPWVFMEICALAGIPDPPVQRMLIRWILAGFSAYMITAVMERPVLRARFLYGLLSGIFFSSLTLFYDFLAFSPEDTPVEDLALIALYNGKDIHDFVYRAVGIFGHANGAAGCVLLGVPILLGAIQEKKIPRWGNHRGVCARGDSILPYEIAWLFHGVRRAPRILALVPEGREVAANGRGRNLIDRHSHPR